MIIIVQIFPRELSDVERGRDCGDGDEHRDVSVERPPQPSPVDAERVLRRVDHEPIAGGVHVVPVPPQQQPEHPERDARLRRLDREEVLRLLRRVEGSWIDAVEGEENRGDDPGGEYEGRGPTGEPEEDAPSPPRHFPSLADGVQVEEPQLGDVVVAPRRRLGARRALRGPLGDGPGLGRGDRHALASKEALQLLVLVHAAPGGAQREPLAPGLGGRRREATAPAHVDARSPRPSHSRRAARDRDADARDDRDRRHRHRVSRCLRRARSGSLAGALRASAEWPRVV